MSPDVTKHDMSIDPWPPFFGATDSQRPVRHVDVQVSLIRMTVDDPKILLALLNSDHAKAEATVAKAEARNTSSVLSYLSSSSSVYRSLMRSRSIPHKPTNRTTERPSCDSLRVSKRLKTSWN